MRVVLGVEFVVVADGPPAYDVRAHRGCRDALEAFLEDAAVPREDHLARAEHPLKGGFSLVDLDLGLCNKENTTSAY